MTDENTQDQTATEPQESGETAVATEPATDTAVAEAPVEGPKAEEAKAPEADKAKAPDAQGDRPARSRRDNRNRKPREPKEFEEAILQIDRVARVNKGGRTMRFRVSIVIGDKKGRVGFAVGKSGEVITAIQKAVAKAKKELITVPLYKDSIPHEVFESFKASKVLLFPAPEGKGVIAGGAVRKILELAGVKNVLSKTHGSRNRLNVARATMDALAQLQKREDPSAKKEEASEAETKKKAAPKKEAQAEKPAPKKKATAKKAAPKKEKTDS